MPVERVDFGSDEEFDQARLIEEQQAQADDEARAAEQEAAAQAEAEVDEEGPEVLE